MLLLIRGWLPNVLVFHAIGESCDNTDYKTVPTSCKALFHLVCFQLNTELRLPRAGICMPVAPAYCLPVAAVIDWQERH